MSEERSSIDDEARLRSEDDVDRLPSEHPDLGRLDDTDEPKPTATALGESDLRERPLLLLVDDDTASRETLAELLGERYSVACAQDGEEAIQLAREHSPDLIVMDVVMPRLGGVGAFEALSVEPRTAEIPVIFLSGQTDETTSVLCLNRGAADYVAKPASAKELFARIDRSLRETRNRRALRAMAQTDALTGLPNFRAFRARLDQELKRASRYHYPLSAVMIDLDHLKAFNDRFGHDTGNRAIIALAHHLQDNLRETDFAARFGGDEFIMLLPHQSSSDAAVFAERIRSGIRELRLRVDSAISGDDVRLSVSAGIACHWSGTAENAGEDLVRAADTALYRAKRNGRDRIFVGDRGVDGGAEGEPEGRA